MESERVLILSTSDIFTVSYGDEVPEGTSEDMVKAHIEGRGDKAGKMLLIVSTGLLEEALARGFRVLVATTRERTHLGEYDQWWIDLVGPLNVFCPDSFKDHAECNPDGDENTRISSGWKKALAAAGVAWPTNGQISPSTIGGPDAKKFRQKFDAEPAFWTFVRRNLDKLGLFGREDLEDEEAAG